MKKLLLWTMLLALAIVVPVPAMARVDISIGISLPPPVVFEAPPDVIVLPDTDDVYVVPGIDADLFFWNGWWWRPWEGGWYRSYYYNRGWAYYNAVPTFYFDVDPGWRGYYRSHEWYGHRWDYDRVPYRGLQRNWKSWHNSRHWEKQGTWGVQNYQPRLQEQRQDLRHKREDQYRLRPEVQQHQQYMQERQKKKQYKQPQVVQPQGQPQIQKQYKQPRVIQPQGQPQIQKQYKQPRVIQPQGQPQIQKQYKQPKVQQPQGQPQIQKQYKQPQGQPPGGHEKGKEDKKDIR